MTMIMIITATIVIIIVIIASHMYKRILLAKKVRQRDYKILKNKNNNLFGYMKFGSGSGRCKSNYELLSYFADVSGDLYINY